MERIVLLTGAEGEPKVVLSHGLEDVDLIMIQYGFNERLMCTLG
jgi:hypothetical protein